MNISELADGTHGTTVHFAVTALGFTCFTVWLIFAVQRRDSMMDGLKWPVRYLRDKSGADKEKKRVQRKIGAGKEIDLVEQLKNGIRRPPKRGDTFDLPEP
jgi:hypothetical protein